MRRLSPSSRQMKSERGICPVCLRSLAVYVSKGGDGSAVLLRIHKKDLFPDGPGWPTRIVCPGSRREPAKGRREA